MTRNEKLTQLWKLHRIPERKALQAALTVAASGVLLFSAGLYLLMANPFTRNDMFQAAAGVAACMLGWVLLVLWQPVYTRVIDRHRRKIAPSVLQLTEELLM